VTFLSSKLTLLSSKLTFLSSDLPCDAVHVLVHQSGALDLQSRRHGQQHRVLERSRTVRENQVDSLSYCWLS
jgi:hypothetical protein